MLGWLELLALDGDLARAEPKTLRYRILHAAARLTRAAATGPEDPRQLALGHGDRDRLEPDHRPAPGTLTSTKPSLRSRKEHGAGGKPGHPARQPGNRRIQTPR